MLHVPVPHAAGFHRRGRRQGQHEAVARGVEKERAAVERAAADRAKRDSDEREPDDEQRRSQRWSLACWHGNMDKPCALTTDDTSTLSTQHTPTD